MSGQGDFWKAVEKKAKKVNPAMPSVGIITSLSPFSIKYNGLDLSAVNGDTIYVNNLMLDENIDLDVGSMDDAQDITELSPEAWIGLNSPNGSFTAKISGTQKQFIIDLYTWIKSVHDRFILHIGDYVAVQKLGNNTYIVLEKLQKVGNEQ